jgi:hypothetical protein
MDEDNI